MKKFDRETFKQFTMKLYRSMKNPFIEVNPIEYLHGTEERPRQHIFDLIKEIEGPYVEPDVSEENKRFQRELEIILSELEMSIRIRKDSENYYDRGCIDGFRVSKDKINNLLSRIKTWREDEEV